MKRFRAALIGTLVCIAVPSFAAEPSPDADQGITHPANPLGDFTLKLDDAFEPRPGDPIVLFRPMYDAWFGAQRHKARYGRALLETGILVFAGLSYYWVDPLANREDWDFPSIGDRTSLRAFRFDTNLNTTNHLLHPVAGGLVYGISRINGLGIPAAFTYAAVQSFLWESVLEWREKPSINDLVYTSIGGVPVGEFIFHASDYFSSAPNGGPAQRFLGWSLGFLRRIHMSIDHEPQPDAPLPLDELGFTSAYWHRLAIGYELAALWNNVGARGALHRTNVDAEFVAMPGFLKPGRFSASFQNGNFTELHARLGFSSDGLDESDLQIGTTLLGGYSQSFSLDDEGVLSGHATMIGIGPAMRFQMSHWLGRHDQLSAVHLPGIQAAVWIADGDLRARLSGAAYPDFASIESLAYPGFVARYGADGTKSVLQKQGYQYSFGGWATAQALIAAGPFAFHGSVGYGNYGSIEGLDRFQERVTKDVHGTDQVLELEAGLGVRLADIVVLGVGVRERRRESSLQPISVRRWDRDVHCFIGLDF